MVNITMNIWDYYKLLGIRQGATDDEIRKAYRHKAMEYHPDRNHSENAHDMFVAVTEAYQYLISHPHKRDLTEEQYRKNYQAWVDYRRAEARKRAEEFARASYETFKKSTLYKSTVVMDGTMVFLGLMLAVATIVFSLAGYFTRLAKAISPNERPSLVLLLVTLIAGGAFLIVSLIYMSVWIDQRKSRKDGTESKNQESI